MRFAFFIAVLSLVFVVGFSQESRADYAVWQDAGTGLSFSFPDNWQQINNSHPDDILTVIAPAGRGHAYCRMRAREERRYMIYPADYAYSVRDRAVHYDFWNNYVDEYKDVRAIRHPHSAGLGRGIASAVMFSFTDEVPGPLMRRRAMAFASVYNGRLYIVECSAHEEAFQAWRSLFQSVIGSVDFKKVQQENLSGHYRDFLDDYEMEFTIPGENYTFSY